MEEWVGQRWHQFIWRAADARHHAAAVRLEDVQRAVQMLFRAGGGDPVVRVTAATAQKVGGPRGWLQKIAGQGERDALSTLDGQTLALPPVIAVFADATLNRQLYLWLAAQGACLRTSAAGWLADNQRATRLALQGFPGLRGAYAALARAHLAQRPAPDRLQGSARTLEQAIQQAIRQTVHEALALPDAGKVQDAPPAGQHFAGALQPTHVAPVWLWLQSLQDNAQPPVSTADDAPRAPAPAPAQPLAQDPKRRRAQRMQDSSSKDGLLMFFRAESILSWAEMLRVHRTADDEDNQDYSQVADDMQELAIAHRQPGETLAARIKFDLDLPSAAADDLPVGPGIALPEWDSKKQALLPDYCRAQRLRHRPQAGDTAGHPGGAGAAGLAESGQDSAQERLQDSWQDPAAQTEADMARRLRATSRQMRRRFEALRAAPRWQRGLTQGDELDLDAWVRHKTDGDDSAPGTGSRAPIQRSESPAIYARRVRSERSLSALLLADLSLSTDAYATQTARVIDLVRDSLYVFGNALDAVGDPFEMLGFSSVRRHVRIHELKRFAERWDSAARTRVAAIKPGFYTRMGAAIRYGSLRLSQRPERQRLLLILTDGKPNDLDHYEGRHGLEDTRHAVRAARQAGLLPFCLTIDQQANAYLPHLFGAQGWALVHRPEQLPRALTQAYVRLTASAGQA